MVAAASWIHSRSGTRAAVPVLGCLLLAGCGQAISVQPGTLGPSSVATATTTSAADIVHPAELVGSWLVTADGEEDGAVLRIADDISLWRRCGSFGGDWRADRHGLFVASINDWSGSCVASADTATPPWLVESAVGFRVIGQVRLLMDGAGATVATLSPGGRPTAGTDVLASSADPPKLTGRLREQVEAGAGDVVTTLRSAGPDDLLGRWVPAGRLPTDPRSPQLPFLHLDHGGAWRGSDGCNGQGGRWVSASDGRLLATSGGQTLVGCNNVDVGSWLTNAVAAAFDGQTLVLLAGDGTETGRLSRDEAPVTPRTWETSASG